MSPELDVQALFEALDLRRRERGLTWPAVAREIWSQSSELNARRPRDHPISPTTISGLTQRRGTSCQHALFFLRWLGRSPESFVPEAAGGPLDVPLPEAGPDRRLRWNLKALHAALDAERTRRRLTWAQTAAEVGCTPNQLTALGTARFATGLQVAMRSTAWLGRPAADFVYATRW